MNILVMDVAADSGGALSILMDFYDFVKENKDGNLNWYFAVSTPELKDCENIKVLRYPEVKKSWLNRLCFDHFAAPKIIKKFEIDKVFSLQNLIVPHTQIEQILYLHQPLPFVEKKFSFNKEERRYWVYQNIIGKKIIHSIRKATWVIVQTNWMKRAVHLKTSKDKAKIFVLTPKVTFNNKYIFKNNASSYRSFFYPASSYLYKNHKLVYEVIEILKSKNFHDFKINVTLENNNNSDDENMVYLSNISRDRVFEFYTKSILLFPSYVETFGLPLLEAKLTGDIIFASDCDFSHEILDGYENAYFFDPFNKIQLADLMEKALNGEIKYFQIKTVQKQECSWNLITELLLN